MNIPFSAASNYGKNHRRGGQKSLGIKYPTYNIAESPWAKYYMAGL